MRQPRRLHLFFAALILTISVVPTSAAGQDRPDAPSAAIDTRRPAVLPGVFGEVLDVRVINLEVVVTDKHGTQILGLGADDFTLMVDGEEMPVDYFSEIRGGVALEPSGPTAEEADGLPGVPSVTPGEYVGTSYLVFIDDFFGLRGDRNAVLESLKDDLPYLNPEDRMALVSYDGEDLEMISSWSSLQQALDRAIDEAMLRPSKGLFRIAERRRYGSLSFDQFGLGSVDNTRPFQEEAFGLALTPEERLYVELVTEQVNRSVAAASATLRSFARPPGRKVMILLSGGWPFVPADYLLGDASRILFDRGGPYGNNLYKRLVETANVLGYTLYPVDLPGLDRRVLDATSAQLATARDPGRVGASSFEREAEVHSTLRYLAEMTGGQALINSRRLGALERVADDIASYYWLGFSPQRERDDVSHDVEVKLRNPEFRVRTRAGFLDSSRDREVSMAVESTLLFGNAASAGSVDVEVGTPVEVPKRLMEVPIRVSIPFDEVTFLPSADAFAAQLELRVAVQDDKGQQAPIPVIPLNLVFDRIPPSGAVGSYSTNLVLRRRFHRAVVALHDPASGRILSTGFEIDPIDN